MADGAEDLMARFAALNAPSSPPTSSQEPFPTGPPPPAAPPANNWPPPPPAPDDDDAAALQRFAAEAVERDAAGDLDNALEAYRNAVERAKRLTAVHPDSPSLLSAMASYSNRVTELEGMLAAENPTAPEDKDSMGPPPPAPLEGAPHQRKCQHWHGKCRHQQQCWTPN